ncbi:glutamine synthetase family protein [Xinfangfangia sp. CPCC 101601]|uniref:Glutamine synthetase family protein n=1 Tax=Pseudogemmobacter lacusdianii TaxID=3069608 RepID=A0ABU0W1C2_9RHOB|nr:glutamine synthetase family protein [Xinfangfangia sp. CPCC 101601]MDQ2067804.1 glutamine synthetase family protein [Xinfangfangia sp. CPCC 101601]
MQPKELVSFVTTDIVALTRGRSVPASALPAALAKGVGWVPANLSLTPFDEIASPNPFGSSGDLRLMPDPATGVRVEGLGGRTPFHIYHSDIENLDGTPWMGCVRSMLKAAVADLEALGLRVVSAFEQEFQILGASWPAAPSFGLAAQRRADPFGPLLMAALEEADCDPECFLPEYGKDQFEIVCGPADALRAADRAVTIREITRELAATMGWHASFCPKTDPNGVGNGVHIHLSLTDLQGNPVTFDANRPGRLSEKAGAFAAGIVRHMAALTALAAPSVVSYQRLKPHNWAASWTTLGEKDREATLRICPTSERPGYDPSRAFNMEFRAADATASPHLSLAMLIRAGIEGIKAGLETPPLISGDPDEMTEAQRESLGIRRLPTSLPEALAAIEADKVVCGWLDPVFLDCWMGMRQKEMEIVADLDDVALCRRYAEVY